MLFYLLVSICKDPFIYIVLLEKALETLNSEEIMLSHVSGQDVFKQNLVDSSHCIDALLKLAIIGLQNVSSILVTAIVPLQS